MSQNILQVIIASFAVFDPRTVLYIQWHGDDTSTLRVNTGQPSQSGNRTDQVPNHNTELPRLARSSEKLMPSFIFAPTTDISSAPPPPTPPPVPFQLLLLLLLLSGLCAPALAANEKSWSTASTSLADLGSEKMALSLRGQAWRMNGKAKLRRLETVGWASVA